MSHAFLKYPPNSEFGGKRVLNLGCGFAKYPAKNVVNIDAFDNCKPNVVHDLNQTPYPFEDESFDGVFANHILEHLPNWWGAFNECARILKPGGVMEVWVPSSGSDAIFGFRDHVAEVNANGFYGCFGTYRQGGNAWALENAMSHANRMKLQNQETRTIGAWWVKRAPSAMRRWMVTHLRNVGVETGFFFTKVSVAEHEKEMERFRERFAHV